jgi:hypothetical protein
VAERRALIAESVSSRDPPDLERAKTSYRRALALSEGLAIRPSRPTATSDPACSTGVRARAAAGAGAPHDGGDHFDEMDMRYWLERSEMVTSKLM